ncbi:MAG: hypothetical protein KDA22_10420, partial [Phycisphaerales bacterium]|nr:hypothetical protein [Phycisphaerales bacterium]
LLLRGDVDVSIGDFRFRSSAATVWINRLPSAEGLINQVAVYFDEAYDPLQLAGSGAQGRDLLVTGSARGRVILRCPQVQPQQLPPEGIVGRGERRLADYLRRLLVAPPELATFPTVSAPPPPPTAQLPEPGASPVLRSDQLPTTVALPPLEPGLPIFQPMGTVDFSGRSVTIDQQSDLVVLDGAILVDYRNDDLTIGLRRLTLAAERAVIFLRPGTIAAIRQGERQVRAEQVDGIYLEGDVHASDGTYTVRGSRVYYDVVRNRALLADAILRTYPRNLSVPVYARAKEMRQISAAEWSADTANISTSEFFTPHLSIGASRITVERTPDGQEVDLVADDATLRAGTTPFFWWPRVAVQSGEFPLRSVSLGGSSSKGVEIETNWDLFSLLGMRKPAAFDAELEIDGFTKRGPALGTRFRYDFSDTVGNAWLWGLYDTGTDRTSSGLDVTPSTEWRGIALWDQTTNLSEHWMFQGQASFISDRTFVSSWYETDFYQRREYETSAYLLYQKNNNALEILGLYNVNDFISNSWLLASRGYSVDRLPDLAYRRYGDSLFKDTLTWSSEYRVTNMRLSVTSGTPNSLGVPAAAFGIGPNDSIQQAFYDQGYRSNYVWRFGTRQELAVPFSLGPVRMSPFGAIGAWAYANDEFQSFSSDADNTRYLLSGGLRASTSFQTVDNAVENRLFDLHRMRHIIEPSATLWYGYLSSPNGSLPVYDQEVEAIGGAAAARFNLRSTWQTQRGGPGRWNSVDFLVIDAGVEFDNYDEGPQSPTPQWFDYRPEYSQFGDHVYGSGVWQISDTFALTGTGTYRINENEGLARGAVGAELRHSPNLTTYLGYRTIDADNTELLDFGVDYRISKKYRVLVVPQFDLAQGGFRAFSVTIGRQFPDFEFLLRIIYDDVQGETRVAASLGRIEF